MNDRRIVRSGTQAVEWRLTFERFFQLDLFRSDRSIQLWCVRVVPDPEPVARFEKLLEPEEVARGKAFRVERLRQNFVVIRGVLRVLLGRYLEDEPERIRLCSRSNGKPYVDHPRRIYFNVSHSDEIALLGFATDREIGVDVEKIRPKDDLFEVARRFFCPEELEDLMSVESSYRHQAFYACWTRKEAYLKATGDGLFTALDSFRVNLRPGDPVRLVHVNGSTADASKWMLHSLDHIPACAAALAYTGPATEVRVLPLLSADAFC